MSRFISLELADEAIAQKIQISNRIKDLVLDELIFIAQTVFVKHFVITHCDCVVHAGA